MISMRKSIATAIGIAALAALPIGPAFADHIQESNANAHASCMAHEASAVSPPHTSSGGNHTEGMPEELAFWDSVIALDPNDELRNRGDIARLLARLHLPTHALCDAAFGLHD